MFYLENYGPYDDLIKNKGMALNSSAVTKQNWANHYNWILNIMKDCIDTDYMKNVFVTIVFENGIEVDLSIIDYWFNLIMWSCIVATNRKIEPKHIFFDDAITRKTIKNYIDKHFLSYNIDKYENIVLNNIIDNCISKYGDIDIFSFFLSNTINLRDFADLMNENPEFDELIHSDLSGVPIGEVMHVGMEKTKQAINIIKNSNHCLANFFQANEGIKDKQFKEVAINIGSKPDGRGGVFPTIVNTNFLTGGVNDMVSEYIESNVGRTAQIIVENNVGDSGYFARLLGLNNSESFLHSNPDYVCNTKNFEKIEIKNATILSRFKNRWYRFNTNGLDYLLNEEDLSLIGKTLYFRSPMTCASAAKGQGICRKCYGKLANINKDINIGKISAELVSSELTQRMLSAKHLLESSVKKMKWTKEFYDLFTLEFNTLKLQDSLNLKGYKLIIDPENIECENDNEENEFNEYITEFEIISNNGKNFKVYTEDYDNMYITIELNEIIREKAKEYKDNKIQINLTDLDEVILFAMPIHNNDLSNTLKKVTDILDKSDTVKSVDRNEILQSFVERVIKGGLNVDSIHCEVLLMNQLRNIDNILDIPKWEYENEPYNLLTLKQALRNHPSITISLEYESIDKMLYNPLTYRKNKPSYMDLFFMEKPQMYLHKDKYVKNEDNKNIKSKRIIKRSKK